MEARTVRRRPLVAALALVLAATLASCAGGAAQEAPPTATAAPSAPPTETPPAEEPTAEAGPESDDGAAPSGTTVTTGDSEFGTMLFDAAGQAIYIWEVETTPEARCYDDCAVAWPPVLTDGDPIASGEVVGSLLGTTTRTDGTTQVTYNGHPLYYYAHEAPGEVKCHDVATHGGLWWVVQPDGNRAP